MPPAPSSPLASTSQLSPVRQRIISVEESTGLSSRNLPAFGAGVADKSGYSRGHTGGLSEMGPGRCPGHESL